MGSGTLILLDTHTWIWWLAEPQKLSKRASEAIQKAERESQVGIAAISCWGVSMLVARGRIGFAMDVETWIEKALSLPSVRFLDLTPKIAVLSTRLPDGKTPANPADRILIATAQIHACPLVTKDLEIQNYPHVASLW